MVEEGGKKVNVNIFWRHVAVKLRMGETGACGDAEESANKGKHVEHIIGKEGNWNA